ncbi:Glu-tRNA(Gln) amidotransferase subunit GatE [Candidatus Micrarchaeota archaeon]|nr:Glu-tRNA(Gln) amidotransferase subunit GatE [Candidatus Micrarchaeota archaeon]
MKIGIEIHQRLDTAKLFCNCPSALAGEDEKPRCAIMRRLHPVLSEMGEADEASQAEFAKDRAFEYHAYSNNCLVEADEEPPALLNPEALRIALQVAMQLNATPVSEVHIMRKMVIDGSNTSGFQRTAIVAMNGHIDSSQGTIRIPLIAIEEESAGIVSATEGKATYRLDRLGIPLIEISTDPDIRDGAHLSEVAEKIGMMLRTSGKVARGLGTIRQDVNISTEGGSRVELKGAQDLKMLPAYVENEVNRQTLLLKLLLEIRERKALPVKTHMVELSDLLRMSKAAIIAGGIKAGCAVIGQRLPEHEGLLGMEIQPGKRYGTELSDYAKKAGVKGIIHSDEDLSKYGITEAEEAAVRGALGADDDDAFVLVVAPIGQAKSAMEFVLQRANMDFIPGETRRANPDGTSSFMRPLPGRARLYPETDVPPIPLTQALLASIERAEPLAEKKARLEKMLNKEMAGRVLKSRHLHCFERLVSAGADPMLAATTLEDTLVSLRREGVEFSDIEKTLTELFSEFRRGSFVKAAIPEVLKGMAKGARVDAVLKVYRLQKISGPELEAIAMQNDFDMRAIMQKYRLQVDPQEVAEVIKEGKKEQGKDFI